MSSIVFSLDNEKKSLSPLQRRRIAEIGMTEPRDLEAWLSSVRGDLFDRSVFWIARQDRPSEEQRSDLVGLDRKGNLLITELKRGELTEAGVTQVLGYAAEYASMNQDDLASMFWEQSKKDGITGLLKKALSMDDAFLKMTQHVDDGIEVNGNQILILVAEDFSPKVLAICDYLNAASGEAKFSFECWRYGLFVAYSASYVFVLEQILPAKSVRQAIEEKREASKLRKYARNPVRMKFMSELMEYIRKTGQREMEVSRSRGQSYVCRLNKPSWGAECEIEFTVRTPLPQLILSPELIFGGDLKKFCLISPPSADDRIVLEFTDVHTQQATFSVEFGDRLIHIIDYIQRRTAAMSVDDAPSSAAN